MMSPFRYPVRLAFYSFILCMLPDLLFSQSGFTEISASAGIDQVTFQTLQMGGGMAWFDYDGDGDEDLYLAGGWGDNILYRNEGNGTFTDVTQASGLVLPDSTTAQGVVTGDIDNDGYREVYISTMWNAHNFLFRNNGDGTFTDITTSSGLIQDTVWTSSSAFADVNRDGYIDLYTGNYVWQGAALYDSTGTPIGYAHRCSENSLYLNNGDGTFTDVATAYNVADTGCVLSIVWSDYDNDDDLDILIANDFGAWVKPNTLYRNEMPAPFTEQSVSSGWDKEMYGMGIATADYDHDLDLDYYMTDIGANAFYHNNGDGTFTDLADINGTLNDSVNGAMTTGWGTFFFDYDNDTWEDLFCANGYIQLLPFVSNSPSDPDMLWHNEGNGMFMSTGPMMGIADSSTGRGAAMADFDMDGDVDFAVTVIRIDTSATDKAKLYRNDNSNGNHWVEVDLEGTVSNRDAYGSRIRVVAGGVTLIREIQGGASHMSQNSSIAHFGLGAATTIDSMWVRWPNGGVQLFTGLSADSLYHITEDSALFVATDPVRSGTLFQVQAWPNPFDEQVLLEGKAQQPVEYEWLDVLGNVCSTGRIIPNSGGRFRAECSTADFVPGIYLLRLSSGRENKTLKLIRTGY